MTVREDAIMRRLIWSVIVVLAASPVAAQNTVKIGQIEAQTGANAIYGYMSSQGLALGVDQVNKAGGFKVGDKTYTVELIASDTRGDPKEASIQLKRLLETDQAKFVFGPFLSNVFVTIDPYAKQFNGKFLLMGGATRIHDFLGTPEHDFLLRTWNWDAGPKGFGNLMVDRLVKETGAKKVAMLFQNDQGGKVLVDIYTPLFKEKGIETQLELFEPGTKDFSAVLAKLAAGKPDVLFPSYSDAHLYDIVRQATEGDYFRRRGAAWFQPRAGNRHFPRSTIISSTYRNISSRRRRPTPRSPSSSPITRRSTSVTFPTIRRRSVPLPATITYSC